MCPVLMALCWGKSDFLSVVAFMLYRGYIMWRHYLINVFSGRFLDLCVLFCLPFSEMSIRLQIGVNSPLREVPRGVVFATW